MFRKSLIAILLLPFSISVASAAAIVEQYDVMSYNSGQHSLYMNGNRYHFASGALFTRYDDGTGTLVGTATTDGTLATAGFDVNLNFGNFRNWAQQVAITSAPHAKGTGNGDETQWSFMDLLPTSTLTGFNGISAVYNLLMKPQPYGKYTYQYGIGANDKNGDLGLSGWFYTANQNGDPGSPCGSNSTCDFNLKLTPVPLPAGLALLPVGLAVLAGMRMRRRSEA
ncbi:VPLPA-CTERM sorting domain-containing protein [uncultured Roseibium sp.]|uniref:VPLPA-CTERM sorting domain-containing protein n=1 Tax=uncultured Roseibium sp. TaxID=1936171 RepID=UPI002602F056|nr:VPLPA-CTERM sorting domain-containing protein [uncultured Roseibium sp.]